MKQLYLFKTATLFVFAIVSLLFFAFNSVNFIHASSLETNGRIVIKQVTNEDVNNKLKSYKTKKNIAKSKTNNETNLRGTLYPTSEDKKIKKSKKSKILKAIKNNIIVTGIKKVYNAIVDLFKKNPKKEKNAYDQELASTKQNSLYYV